MQRRRTTHCPVVALVRLDRDRGAVAQQEIVGVVHTLEAACSDHGVDMAADLERYWLAHCQVSGGDEMAYLVWTDDRVEAGSHDGLETAKDPVLRVDRSGEEDKRDELCAEHRWLAGETWSTPVSWVRMREACFALEHLYLFSRPSYLAVADSRLYAGPPRHVCRRAPPAIRY